VTEQTVPNGTKMQLEGFTATVTGYSSGQGYRLALSSNAGVWHGWCAKEIVDREYKEQIGEEKT